MFFGLDGSLDMSIDRELEAQSAAMALGGSDAGDFDEAELDAGANSSFSRLRRV